MMRIYSWKEKWISINRSFMLWIWLIGFICKIIMRVSWHFYGNIEWYSISDLKWLLLILFFYTYGIVCFFLERENKKDKKIIIGQDTSDQNNIEKNGEAVTLSLKSYLDTYSEKQILIILITHIMAIFLGAISFSKLTQSYTGIRPAEYLFLFRISMISYILFFGLFITNNIIRWSNLGKFRIKWNQLMPIWDSFEKNPSSSTAGKILKLLPKKKYTANFLNKDKIHKMIYSEILEKGALQGDENSIKIIYQLMNITREGDILNTVLCDYLGMTIKANPNIFLKMLKENFKQNAQLIANILTPRMFKAGEDNTKMNIHEIQQRKRALKTVCNKDLAKINEHCLQEIEIILNKLKNKRIGC